MNTWIFEMNDFGRLFGFDETETELLFFCLTESSVSDRAV